MKILNQLMPQNLKLPKIQKNNMVQLDNDIFLYNLLKYLLFIYKINFE